MPDTFLLARDQLQLILDALRAQGYSPIGPRLERGAIVYGPLASAADLPVGYLDSQDGGHYRLTRADPGTADLESLFRYAVGPQTWKRYLFPPHQTLWRARRDGEGFEMEAADGETPRYAFIGVRACELAAMRIQDRVFAAGAYADSGYGERRGQAFILAVNCTRAGGTCFCASAHTGPKVRGDFDLCLTELPDEEASHGLLVDVGSESGRQLLEQVSHRPAHAEEIDRAHQAVEEAASNMGRQLHPDAADILRRNPEHPRWADTASRCMGCGNCTLVCPTCFCSTVEDTTSLDGSEAERRRQWDSCFNLEFSYIYGGPVRRDAGARYRHWITHKLASWHKQFGTSGCTGCGRCITWCPVGIDITAEVAALRSSERVLLETNLQGED